MFSDWVFLTDGHVLSYYPRTGCMEGTLELEAPPLELQLKTVRLLLGQHRQSKLVLFRLEV